jgi:DNA-binding transcriptional ArsR family regulator
MLSFDFAFESAGFAARILTGAMICVFITPMLFALKILAEPRRQAILRLVWDQERTAGEIAAHFDITRPAVSQHLRVLEEGGLLNVRKEGTRRIYAAEKGRLEALAPLFLTPSEAGSLAHETPGTLGWRPEVD